MIQEYLKLIDYLENLPILIRLNMKLDLLLEVKLEILNFFSNEMYLNIHSNLFLHFLELNRILLLFKDLNFLSFIPF